MPRSARSSTRSTRACPSSTATAVVTLWNDALERILGCPRERALGRPLAERGASARPDRAPASDQGCLDDPHAPDARASCGCLRRRARGFFEVKVLPVAGGVTLLWHDVTERTRAEQALKRSEERLALAAEGANDGLWEWDLRTPGVLRLRPLAGDARPARDRRHRSSRGLARPRPRRRHRSRSRRRSRRISSGKTDHFQHEHRIRHEDGTYRRFLCRGVAVRGAGRRAGRIAGSLTDTTEQAIAQEQLRSVGFLDPLTGLCNRAVFVEGLGRRLEEFKQQPRRQPVRGALSRPRSLQGRQRQPRPPGRRRAADRGVAPPRVVPAAGRRAGAAGRRRVRDSPERARRRAAGQRHRVPHSGSAERAVLDRRARSVHLGEHRHRLRPGAVQQPGRDHARRRHRDVSRQVARQGAPRAVRCRHARARAATGSASRTTCATPSPTTTSRCTTSRSCSLASGHVRRVRVAGPMDAQRQAGLAGDVHPDRRGARAHRAARHVGAPAGVLDVRRLAAAISRLRASTTSPSTCRAGS